MLSPLSLIAQSESSSPRQTYAILVGISNYEDPAINPLKFAHRDAQFFADFLRSESGGQVPDKNIILLQNEAASWSAVYNAMDDIASRCNSGDRVYFYFSGHGDIENEKIYKMGFLIAYNTPHINYINSAIRLVDLNNFANTLSSEKNVEVILVTDACHSGNVSGNDFRGGSLVAEQLQSIVKNEVRLASCEPHEVSLENEQWGGGRSVFSYYLVKGLQGLAETDQDGVVSVKEIDNYLSSSLKSDKLLLQQATKQTPVVVGNEKLLLSKSTGGTIQLDSVQSMWDKGLDTLTALTFQHGGSFFKLITNPKDSFGSLILSSIPFSNLRNQPIEEIPNVVVSDAIEFFEHQGNTSDNKKMLIELQHLKEELKINPNAKKRFLNQFLIACSNLGQTLISLYQQADEDELDKRKYYNSVNNSYQIYADMLFLAQRCAHSNSRINSNLETQHHYFQALTYRLATFTSNNADSLLLLAEKEIQQALKLEEYAAYLYQELGQIKLYQNKIDVAEKNFKMAEQIAPRWTLPKTYLAAVNILKKNYPMAKNYIQQALAMQPEQNTALLYAGMLHQELRNDLLAEEYFNRAMERNSRNYLPFERMAFLKLRAGKYVTADSLFLESEVRKKGFHFRTAEVSPTPNVNDLLNAGSNSPSPCPDSNTSEDVLSLFVSGQEYLRKKDTTKALEAWFACIQQEPTMPLVHYYIGRICTKKEEWLKAEYYLLQAKKFALSEDSFMNYATRKSEEVPVRFQQCVLDLFVDFDYPPQHADYLLAFVYKRLHRYELAMDIYRNLIRTLKPMEVFPFVLLSGLLEESGRYLEAEQVLQNYYSNSSLEQSRQSSQFSSTYWPYELNALYNRILTKQPKDMFWLFRAGLFEADQAMHSKIKLKDKRFQEGFGNPTSGIRFREDRMNLYVPGSEEPIIKANEPDDLLGTALRRLQTLSKASSDISMVYTANLTLGKLYQYLGATYTATTYFQKAIQLSEKNADLRLTLMACFQDNKLLYQEWLQADTLFQHNQLPLQNLLQFAHYTALSNDLKKARQALAVYQKSVKLTETDFDEENAFLNFYSGNYQVAIAQYEALLKLQPNNVNYYMALADMNLQTKRVNKAYYWLQMALDKGFDGPLVLRYNPVWQKERKRKPYLNILSKYPTREISN